MRYKKLTLNNFRTFHGKHEITFPDKKGIFLVHAQNGVGKSAIYHAFRYVLYGETLSQETREKLNVIDLLSIDAKKEGKNSFSVRLEFEHENMDYELTRGHQSNVSGIKPTQDNHFDSNLSLIKDGDVIPEKDIKVEVDNLLRKDISDFFIVDNEYVGDLFNALKSEDSTFIKKGIDQTIGVGILEDGKDDFKQIHEKFGAVLGKEARKNKEQEKLSKEFVTKETLYKESTKALDELSKNKTKIDKEVETLKKKRDSLKVIEENVNEANKLEEDLEKFKKQKETFFEKIQTAIVDEWFSPVQNTANAVLDIQTKLVNQKIKREGEISKLQDQIKDLNLGLKNNKCHTCKQDLPKQQIKAQEDKKTNLEKQLEKLESQPSENLISPHPSEITKFTEVNKKLIQELETQYYQVSNDINRSNRNLKKLNESLKKGDNAEVRRIAKSLEDAQILQREISIEYSSQEKINEYNRKSLESVTRKLAKALTGDSTTKQIVDVADNLQGLLEKSHEEFSVNARELVKTCASAAFKEIINSKNFDIDINEDYAVSFLDTSKEGVGAASMGQGRVIAVGLMAGLSEASITEAPILIDSPMVGLDITHVKNLYNFFPKLSDQVILLVPPGEWVENQHRKITNKTITGEVTLEKISPTSLKIHEGFNEKHLPQG